MVLEEVHMSAADEYGSTAYGRAQTGWVGWMIFASILMIMVGAVNVIQGLAALFRAT